MLDISVVINTCNQPDELRLCLAALEAQTLPHDQWEIIIVDDGSDDNAAIAIAEAYNGKSNCRPIPREHIGRAAARNVGMAAARGQYILFLADDVLASPDLLQQHLDAHKRYDPVAVIGQTEWTPECGSDILRQWTDNRAVWEIGDSLDAGFQYFYTGNASVERRLLLDIGGFDENYTVCGWEDLDLALRMHTWGIRMIYYARAFATHNHPHTTLKQLCRRQYERAFSAAYFFQKWKSHNETETLRFWNGPSENLKTPSLLATYMRSVAIQIIEAVAPSAPALRRLYARLIYAHQIKGLKLGTQHYQSILHAYHSRQTSPAQYSRCFQGIEPDTKQTTTPEIKTQQETPAKMPQSNLVDSFQTKD